MNGLDLYNFMYDQFVWPKHPFASRDVRPQSSARGPRDINERAAVLPGDASPTDAGHTAQSPRAVIVLADHRRKEST